MIDGGAELLFFPKRFNFFFGQECRSKVGLWVQIGNSHFFTENGIHPCQVINQRSLANASSIILKKVKTGLFMVFS